MKIKDILFEKESSFISNAKEEILNYLSSLRAVNNNMFEPISTEQLISFMQKLGFDLNEASIANMLDETPYEIQGDKISLDQSGDDFDTNKKKKQDSKEKVSGLAKKHLKKREF